MVESLKPGHFIINGLKSSDYKVFIQDRPDIETPKRRVTFESPNGYEGELAFDDEGYEPTEFELHCFYDGRSHDDSDRDISLARNRINFLFNHGIGNWINFSNVNHSSTTLRTIHLLFDREMWLLTLIYISLVLQYKSQVLQVT